MLRFAKRVLLYDRNVGTATWGAGTGQPVVPARYAETLSWIVGCYARVGEAANKRVDLVTGLDAQGLDAAQVDAVRTAVQRHAGRVSQATGIPVSASVSAERVGGVRTGDPMWHARFVIADQLGVLIERGFDLLRPSAASAGPSSAPRPLRDFVVARLRDWPSIEDHANRLAASSAPLAQ